MMRRLYRVALTGLVAVLPACGSSNNALLNPIPSGDSLLATGDPILAIDLDPPISRSNYPSLDGPANALDGIPNTRYLNYGGPGSGLIVTPQFGASTIRSLQLTTSNTAAVFDPASFELFGTNDAITSVDNSTGQAENWTLIASGPLALPDTRLTDGPVVPFSNSHAYTSYKLMFPEVKSGSAMAVAEVTLFESTDGTGTNVLAPGDAVLAVNLSPDSQYPSYESPPNALDNDEFTKYLNFGEINSGFIITPSIGPSIVGSFRITTANDFPERDPTSFELYGTNDPITSADNSRAMDENWMLIDSGSIALPDARFTEGPLVEVAGYRSFKSYLFVVTGVKDSAAANSMQFSGIQFLAR